MSKKKSHKSNYLPTKIDFEAMSACLSNGYIVFCDFKKDQKWLKYAPLIILRLRYKGYPYDLIPTPFKQSYLGYYTFKFYRKIYQEKILNNITVISPKQVKALPEPPSPSMPPPPPNVKKDGSITIF